MNDLSSALIKKSACLLIFHYDRLSSTLTGRIANIFLFVILAMVDDVNRLFKMSIGLTVSVNSHLAKLI